MSVRLPAGPEPLIDDTLWDTKDVARFLKASVSWVYKAAERGDLPCLRLGAMLRFEQAAIRAWLAAHRGGSSLTVTPHQSVTQSVGSSHEGRGLTMASVVKRGGGFYARWKDAAAKLETRGDGVPNAQRGAAVR